MSKRVGPLRLNVQQFQQWEMERVKSPIDTIFNPITGNKISYQGETWKRLEEAYLKMKQKQLATSLTTPKQGRELEQLMDALDIVQRHTRDPKMTATLTMVSKDLRNRALGKDKPSSKDIKAEASQLQKQHYETALLNEMITKQLIIEASQRTNFIDLQMGAPIPKKNRHVEEPDQTVILFVREKLRERLDLIRKVTRSQKASTLAKASTTTTRKPETADTVLTKLHSWCETHRQIALFEGLQRALTKDIETLTDQQLIEQIYTQFNINRDIAKIYAYYLKEYLYQILVQATELLEIRMTSGLSAAQAREREKVLVLTVESIRPYLESTYGGKKKSYKKVSKK